MIACDEFKVKGETVLEFGAGAALPSIVAMLSGAKEASVTLPYLNNALANWDHALE